MFISPDIAGAFLFGIASRIFKVCNVWSSFLKIPSKLLKIEQIFRRIAQKTYEQAPKKSHPSPFGGKTGVDRSVPDLFCFQIIIRIPCCAYSTQDRLPG